MQNTCVTCPNFNPVVEDNGASQIHRGECRAKPPTVHMLVIPGAQPAGARVMAMQQQPAIVGQSVFPAVQSDSWCAFHPERDLGAGLF